MAVKTFSFQWIWWKTSRRKPNIFNSSIIVTSQKFQHFVTVWLFLAADTSLALSDEYLTACMICCRLINLMFCMYPCVVAVAYLTAADWHIVAERNIFKATLRSRMKPQTKFYKYPNWRRTCGTWQVLQSYRTSNFNLSQAPDQLYLLNSASET